jgi:crossover junction endodeoxyribonuclease RusA
MHDTITYHFPYPPSVNHYWGQRGNLRFVGKAGKLFREEVAIIALKRTQSLYNARLKLEVYLYPPDKRKRDIDNNMKSLLDAMEHAGVYENDSQIDELHIYRGETTKGGACKVILSSLNA